MNSNHGDQRSSGLNQVRRKLLSGVRAVCVAGWMAVSGLSAAVAQAQLPAANAQPPIRLAMIEGLSGPFANTGEAVFRNLFWAIERVNAVVV